MTWLLDTLVWTGVLIGLVLLVRRPVARHFGARVAYALWFLPLLRLFLPPLVLPASTPSVAPVVPVGGEYAVVFEMAEAPAPVAAAPVAEASSWLPGIEIMLLALWLVGALVYAALRLAAYRRLRADLLAGARSVGLVGKIRLLETPGTRSPLAFGVVDKVIALPPGFMAHPDRAARDLALEHELAHHRAHDLAANFAALALFAIHWFSPLSWLGWNAMRRDQEAACDARVIEGRGRGERARYAALIADAAAAPRAALAAPMACPVLGDKSIIQRLRNLTMTDLSQRRRRLGGLLVGFGALALPLTASITYAQIPVPDEPSPPPPVEAVAPRAPLPPEAPHAPLAPEAPPAPDAPLAPKPPHAPKVHIERITLDGPPGAVHERRIILSGPDGKALSPDSPEFEAKMKMLEERLGNLDMDIESRMQFSEKQVKRMRELAERAARDGVRMARLAPRIEMNCGGDEDVTETRGDDGHRVIRFCRAKMLGGALTGLRSARAAIAGNAEMSAETRAEVLEKLDREIERLEAKD